MPFNESIKFINPYTFIPSDYSKTPRSDLEKVNEKFTGILNCRLITKTPIAIPDPETRVEENGHPSFKFMRMVQEQGKESEPFIPGSSIRGVIRSVYETITDSCYLTTDPEETITYRNAGKGFEPGILKKTATGYELWKAKRYIFKVIGRSYTTRNGRRMWTYKPFDICPNIFSVDEKDLKQYRYGQEVQFKECSDKFGSSSYQPWKGGRKQLVGYYVGSIETDPEKFNSTDRKGYICIGMPFDNVKHFESVFWYDPDNNSNMVCSCDISNSSNNLKDSIRVLDKIVEMYNDEKINSILKLKPDHTFYPDRSYRDMGVGDCYPVWYKTIDGTVTDDAGNIINDFQFIDLSVADLGRSAYGKNMGQLLNQKKPCETRKKACAACQLFGLVGESDVAGASAGSRVRFTNAVLTDPITEKDIQKDVVLRELASPKTSYMPFYSRVTSNANGKLTRDDWSYNRNDVELRGRKFYWHNIDSEAYKAPLNRGKPEKTNRNSTMELVGAYENRDGKQVFKPIAFKFSVFFDSVTEEELENLKWVLTLGNNQEDDEHCHKIGHGKPIGLGSVKIVIDEEVKRNLTSNCYQLTRTSKTAITISNGAIFDNKLREALLNVTSLNACNYPVKYPFVADSHGKPYQGGNNNKYAAHVWFSNNYPVGEKAPTFILPEIGEQNSPDKGLQAFQRDEDYTGAGVEEENPAIPNEKPIKSHTNGEILEATIKEIKEKQATVEVDGSKEILYCKIELSKSKISKEFTKDVKKVKIRYDGDKRKWFVFEKFIEDAKTWSQLEK